MKKIDLDAAQAFYTRKPFARSNTTITVEGDTLTMRLHGHVIARMNSKDNTLALTLADHNTQTTRARLNGLLYMLPLAEPARYRQQDFAAVFCYGKDKHDISAASWQHFTRASVDAPWIYKD